MTRSMRNGNIECLRFLFAICVMLMHCKNEQIRFSGGYLAVEFFFLLSGLFLGKALRQTQDVPQSPRETVRESTQYILRRIRAVFPYLLPASLIGFCVRAVCGEYRFGLHLLGQLLYLPFELLFLQNLGFPSPCGTGVGWYLSALFFSLWLLYPFLRRHYAVCVRYAAVPLSLWIVGFLNSRFDNLNLPCIMIGPFNTGILRAVAMLLLGAAIGEGAAWLQKQPLNKHVRFMLTAVECVLYTGVFGYMAFSYFVHERMDQLVVPIMAVALLCTASERSLLHGKLNGRVSLFLGKFSMLLFLNHFCWVRCSGKLLNLVGITLPDAAVMAIGILLSFAASLMDWALGNALRRLGQSIYRKIFSEETTSIEYAKEN